MDKEFELSYTASEVDDRLGMAGNAILYTEQVLTEEQKKQARANIGAISKDEENITEEDVQYHYDGDKQSGKYEYVFAAITGARTFVKIASLPEQGELNLVGASVSVETGNSDFNFQFVITEEMLKQSIYKDGVIISATMPYQATQIFYQSKLESSPITYIFICYRPGEYNVAFDGWYSKLTFSEKGIYLIDGRDYDKNIYVDYLNATVVTKINSSGNVVSTSPIAYGGNEIQIFNRGICIGDSITEGMFDHSGGNMVNRKYSYPAILSRITGIDIVNAGVSGLTSKTWYEASLDGDSIGGRWVNNEWVWSLAPNAKETDVVSKSLDYSGFDFGVIHLGINDTDSLQNITIEEGLSIFETNINGIISKLKESSKGIRIFLATIIPYRAINGSVVYERFNEKIREIANSTEDVFLIDLTTHSECYEGSIYGHGYHMTTLGHHKMASEIASYISYIISNNLEDFKWVQFINTSYTP